MSLASVPTVSSERSRGSRIAIGLLISGPLWLGIAVGVATGKWWIFSSGPTTANSYVDLGWVAKWAQCLSERGLSDVISNCGIAYPIPGVWIAASLGLNPSWLPLAGQVLAVLWGVCATLLIISVMLRSGFPWAVTIGLMLSAPPTWLLLERGNLDVVVWMLMFGAFFAVRASGNFLAATCIALGTLLKIFPVGTAVMYLQDLRVRPVRAALLLGVSMSALLLTLLWGLTVSDRRPTPVGDAFGAFHPAYLARVLIAMAQGASVESTGITRQIPVSAVDYVLGGLLFLAGVIASFFFLKGRVNPLPPAESRILLGSLGLIGFSYLTGSNFDYRLTFVPFVILGVSFIAPMLASRLHLMVPSILLVVSMWMCVGLPLPLQLIGDATLWLGLTYMSGLALCLLFGQLRDKCVEGESRRVA